MQFSVSGKASAPVPRSAGRAAGCSVPAAAHAVPRVRCQQATAPVAGAFAPVVASMAAPRRCMRQARRGDSIRTAASAAAADSKNKGIQVTKSDLSDTKRRVSITIPSSLCQEGFKATVENLKKIVGKLPGFRDDKIPLSMLVTQCGGQQKFKMTVIEEILTTTMPLALDKLGEPVVPDSTRIVSDIRQMEAAFDPAKPFSYDVEYETVLVKWTSSYKDMEVTIRDNGNFSTDTKTVDNIIRNYLKQKGFQRVVAGRGLQAGDACVMDLMVCPKGSSKPLTGMQRDKFPMDTDVDPIGLVPNMVGMASGEERKFNLTIPSDYSVELWRGMAVDVKVKVHEIFNWVMPEFNDEFVAAHFASDFASAEDMRKGLMTTAAMDRVKGLDGQLEDKLVEGVISLMDVPELPESLVNEMGSTQYRGMLMNMLQTNVASREELEEMLTEEAVDKYIADNRKDIEDMLKFNLAIEHIFHAEKLAIDDADIQAEVDSQKQTYKAQGLEYDEQVLREQVMESFKSVKVIEWLKDNIKRNTLPYEG